MRLSGRFVTVVLDAAIDNASAQPINVAGSFKPNIFLNDASVPTILEDDLGGCVLTFDKARCRMLSLERSWICVAVKESAVCIGLVVNGSWTLSNAIVVVAR